MTKPRKPLSRRKKADPARAARTRAKAEYTTGLAALYGVEAESDAGPFTGGTETEIAIAAGLNAALRTVNAGPRVTGPAIEKPLRLRSRAYLDSVKGDPCEAGAPGDPCLGLVDAHHARVRGRRDDTFDLTAIPLCRRHHRLTHDGAITARDSYEMLGAYLCRKLPRLSRSEARRVLAELLAGID